jgi:lycopene cyclase domain-containing protein
MTYFSFLVFFLAVPIAAFLIFFGAQRPGVALPGRLTAMRPAAAIAITCVVAVLYTTPWDNYLVATGVWSYDRTLVSGVVLGYVPLEEYLFFVLQTILTSLWLIFLARRSPAGPVASAPLLRRWLSLPIGMVWLIAGGALSLAWGPSRYSALLFAWALLPILIQLAFGADLLWQERRLVLPAILVATLYYSVADTFAVASGTWDFHSGRILGVHLGPLPIEEVAFFLLTNTLIVFSVTLLLSAASLSRFQSLTHRARGLRIGPDQGRSSS